MYPPSFPSDLIKKISVLSQSCNSLFLLLLFACLCIWIFVAKKEKKRKENPSVLNAVATKHSCPSALSGPKH